MKKPKFTYDRLIVDHELRAELFTFIDDQRRLAKEQGFLEAVKLHNMNAKRIAADLAQYD
ncbi:hypothetical protein I6F11_05975 [Ensifer sp. NBAIM29]|nr:hypothetical protein [Ensifer sp. NBAIM29]